MKSIVISWILILCVSCGGSEGRGSCRVGTDTTDGQGHICSKSGVWVAVSAGQCSLPSDCPPPYNNCASNLCVAQKVTGSCQQNSDCLSGSCRSNYCTAPDETNPQIWFATDPIRPGANSGDPFGYPGLGYVYNIMAKGYASLDDWCMSQAQQSTIPAMRNIGSWTALIIAQPDNGQSSLGDNGKNRYNALMSLSTDTPPAYLSPGGTSQFNANNATLYDKNNSPISNLVAWSGINRNFCQAIVADYATYCVGQCKCINVGECINKLHYYPYPAENSCGFQSAEFSRCYQQDLSSNCRLYVTTVSPLQDENIRLGPFCYSNSNAWGSSKISDPGSVFILTTNGCLSGFDFASDCLGGSTYNANGSAQHSILCLANQ